MIRNLVPTQPAGVEKSEIFPTRPLMNGFSSSVDMLARISLTAG